MSKGPCCHVPHVENALTGQLIHKHTTDGHILNFDDPNVELSRTPNDQLRFTVGDKKILIQLDKTIIGLMSNQMNIIAALCAKANDAAFANEISIAVGRFHGEEDSAYEEENPAEFVASICVKASAFKLEDHYLNPSTSEAPREPNCPSVSKGGHKITNLHPDSLPALLNNFETMSTDCSNHSSHEELTNHSRLTVPSCAFVEYDSSAYSLMGVEKSNLARSLNEASEFVVSKPREGPWYDLQQAKRNITENHVADVVAAALESFQEDYVHLAEVTKCARRVRRSKIEDSNMVLESTRKRWPSRALSTSLRHKLDKPKTTCDGSTHSPSGEEFFREESTTIVVPTDEELEAIGWGKALDPSTGNYYFFSIDRSKVAWESPLTKV